MTRLEDIDGVDVITAKQLRDAHITTLEHLAIHDPKDLRDRVRIGEATSKSVVDSSRKLLGMERFMTGTELEQDERYTLRLSTGIRSLDKMLMGGMTNSSIIDIAGGSQVGKSQWCHQLMVNAYRQPEHGGLGTKTLWISNARSMRSTTVRTMARRFCVDPESILRSVNVIELDFGFRLIGLLPRIYQKCCEEGFGLLVLDSIMFPEWSHYMRLEQSEDLIMQLMYSLRRFSQVTGKTIIYTNPSLGYTLFGASSLGDATLKHGADYRFFLSMRNKGTRRLSLSKSPEVPSFHMNLHLGYGGYYESQNAMRKQEMDMRDIIKDIREGQK